MKIPKCKFCFNPCWIPVVLFRKPIAWIAVITACYFLYGHLNVRQSDTDPVPQELVTNATKHILIWNAYSRFELETFGQGKQPFIDSRCKVNDCFITRNKSLRALSDFDAVIFNMPPLAIRKFPVDLQRRPEQRYIFFSQEPPTYIGEEVDKFNNLFNWTMTYASHSDIQYHYGEIIKRKPSYSVAETNSSISAMHGGRNFALGKTKMVAWFVSHCFTQSRREKYVNILRQHIAVDIYGGCHQLKCSMNESAFLSTSQCYDMLENDYKFYLAFENSFCSDYVTEKFFNTLQRNIIPVVLGGANYSAIAPPHSYIDASNYSPRKLAAYLKLLASNDALYNEYFWWKPFYRVVTRYPALASRALCLLCEKLHFNKTRSVYSDLATGWSQATQCTKPRYKGVSIFLGIF